jgi:hypothetical protein
MRFLLDSCSLDSNCGSSGMKGGNGFSGMELTMVRSWWSAGLLLVDVLMVVWGKCTKGLSNFEVLMG